MTAKEEKLEELFKQTTKVSSEYDEETKAMLALLRKQRDEQVKIENENFHLSGFLSELQEGANILAA